MNTVLDVRALEVHFTRRRFNPLAISSTVRAVDGVSFQIERGRTLGLVGESGSGKTSTALAVMRLVQATAGSIHLNGQDITHCRGDALRKSRADFQMIFQDPYSSLNPRVRIGDTVRSPLDRINRGNAAQREEKVIELLEGVGLRPDQRTLFPHQFSGGQRQRINIARALATAPKLIVCDEPVSALDVAVRAQTLNLLRRLQREMALTYLFISHDMAVVEYMCDDVAVMYMGQIVEHAAGSVFFKRPLHPYSRALMSAVPRVSHGAGHEQKASILHGDPPDPANPPPGCRFAARCPFAEERCRREAPQLRKVGEGGKGRLVACHLVDDAGKPPQDAMPGHAIAVAVAESAARSPEERL